MARDIEHGKAKYTMTKHHFIDCIYVSIHTITVEVSFIFVLILQMNVLLFEKADYPGPPVAGGRPRLKCKLDSL